MKVAQINEILGITESFKLPDILMAILLDDTRRTLVMDQFMAIGESLDHDWFTEYFEEEHANKSKMAQDFTPKGPADILGHIIDGAETVADVCAGTGGLSISQLTRNAKTKLICYELSERAIPLLLFNLSIRNATATVVREDILTGEIFETYQVTPTPNEKYSKIQKVDAVDLPKVDAVISNPPYSLKYKPDKDSRFPETISAMLPSNYADYVFIFFALQILKPGGRAGFILPHGVLFRGDKEKKCRQYLIDRKVIKSVIGLPEKLFINTAIPTMILELATKRGDSGILFIDASDLYKKVKKVKKLNLLTSDHVSQICDALNSRQGVEHFAALIELSEIIENDYNLNIPRYVDTFVPEQVPEPADVLKEIATYEQEKNKSLGELLTMSKELFYSDGTPCTAFVEIFRKLKNIEESQSINLEQF